MPHFGFFLCRILILGLFLVPVFSKYAFATSAEKKVSSNKVAKDLSPPILEMIRKIPHSGYSEGLDFYEGFLWGALPKKLRKIDPKDGTVLETFTPPTDYSESLVWFKGLLWNVSFSDNSIHSGKKEGDKIVFTKRGTVPEIHAWGLCHDGKNVVMTGDYSNKLYFYDPGTVKLVRTLVTEGKDLEDLAWDGKTFWTSSFTEHHGEIFRVDPKTGKILGYFQLPEKDLCPVIDGIAFDGKSLWVAGKECSSIWNLKLPK